MAMTPPTHYTVFQGMACPECRCPESHIQDVYTSTGIRAYGRSDERTGAKILWQCERGHAYIVGMGEHKGAAFVYVRLPLGDEVVGQAPYYGSVRFLGGLKFTGKHDYSWHPKATQDDTEYAEYPLEGGLAALDSEVWA